MKSKTALGNREGSLPCPALPYLGGPTRAVSQTEARYGAPFPDSNLEAFARVTGPNREESDESLSSLWLCVSFSSLPFRTRHLLTFGLVRVKTGDAAGAFKGEILGRHTEEGICSEGRGHIMWVHYGVMSAQFIEGNPTRNAKRAYHSDQKKTCRVLE